MLRKFSSAFLLHQTLRRVRHLNSKNKSKMLAAKILPIYNLKIYLQKYIVTNSVNCTLFTLFRKLKCKKKMAFCFYKFNHTLEHLMIQNKKLTISKIVFKHDSITFSLTFRSLHLFCLKYN